MTKLLFIITRYSGLFSSELAHTVQALFGTMHTTHIYIHAGVFQNLCTPAFLQEALL